MPDSTLTCNPPLLELGETEERRQTARKLVEAELGRIRVGDRLPAMRDLRARCGVGLTQLQQIVDDLQQAGFIERRPRSGLYKAKAFDVVEALTAIDVIACGRLVDVRNTWHHSYAGELLKSLATEAGERGLSLRFRQVFAHESVSRYEAMAQDPAVRACLLLTPHLPELAAMFQQQGVHTVSMLPRQWQTAGPTIADNPTMVQLQFQHLWELGHRRIAYMDLVNPLAPGLSHLHRKETFYRMVSEHQASFESHWVFHIPFQVDGQWDPAVIERQLQAVFASKQRPTALICGDSFAPHLYRFAQRRGWVIGRDLSVVGTDNMPIATLVEPPLTSVDNRRDVVARLALDAVERLWQGQSVPEVQHMPLDLIHRDSSGPPV